MELWKFMICVLIFCFYENIKIINKLIPIQITDSVMTGFCYVISQQSKHANYRHLFK